MIKSIIQNILKRYGYHITRFPDELTRLKQKQFASFRINKVLDVGANDGWYTQQLRAMGFTGHIYSFEPLQDVFRMLESKAILDSEWDVYPYALGHEAGVKMINVSRNSVSSSLLEMLPAHLQSAPESEYLHQEQIDVRTLDSVFESFYTSGDQVLLKIDAQGYERNILEGAAACLPLIRGIQLEMSVIPLYNGETLFADMIDYLQEKGFTLYGVENGFTDEKTGEVLQIDGTFYRKQDTDYSFRFGDMV